MISFLAYILILLLNLFVTTILITDINSKEKTDDKNLKFMIFASFFSVTLASVCSIISTTEQGVFYYAATIAIIFLVINSLIDEFDKEEKLKVYLICLCSILFGFGGLSLILIGFIAALVSYIILYNSADFHKFFFSGNDKLDKKELEDFEVNEDTK